MAIPDIDRLRKGAELMTMTTSHPQPALSLSRRAIFSRSSQRMLSGAFQVPLSIPVHGLNGLVPTTIGAHTMIENVELERQGEKEVLVATVPSDAVAAGPVWALWGAGATV